jgi:cytochrome bd-type quinol oxidase subunit 2
LWIGATVATAIVRMEMLSNALQRPLSIVFVLMSVAALCGVFWYLQHARGLAAFLASSAFLLGLMGATMTGTYPYWLYSTIDPAFSLTAPKTVAASYGLQTGLVWWSVGIVLATGYFVFLYGSLREKISTGSGTPCAAEPAPHDPDEVPPAELN